MSFSTSSVGQQNLEGGNGSLILLRLSKALAALGGCLRSPDPTAWRATKLFKEPTWNSDINTRFLATISTLAALLTMAR